MKGTIKERRKLIRKINEDINDILIEDRIYVGNMIAMNIGKNHLYGEGLGCRVSFSKLNTSLLKQINEYIKESLKKTKLNLD